MTATTANKTSFQGFISFVFNFSRAKWRTPRSKSAGTIELEIHEQGSVPPDATLEQAYAIEEQQQS
jgi:hypothetical protein